MEQRLIPWSDYRDGDIQGYVVHPLMNSYFVWSMIAITKQKFFVTLDLQKNKALIQRKIEPLFFYSPEVIIFQHASVRKKTLIFVLPTITPMPLWWSIKVVNLDFGILLGDYFILSELQLTAKFGS